MIQLKNVDCGYGSKVILSDLNLWIEPGMITCILAKNGIGKTTLFKTILGLLPKINGTITINTKKLSQLTHKEIAQEISYVPQAHGTPFPYSVLDVVLMGQFAHSSNVFGRPGKNNVAVALESLESLGLTKFAERSFSKLSGGEKQMVLIARALAQKPTYIAMDEPTANLDMGNSINVMKLAIELKNKGYGIIMNTHSPEQALHYADKVILLEKGGLLNMGTPKEVLSNSVLSNLYKTPLELVETITSDGTKREVLIAV